MPLTKIEQLEEVQKDASRIRNICVLAHVDHGKTTLSDSLLSINGIVSQRLAGQVRYLDNTVEEQERFITMKSSSCALLYIYPHLEDNTTPSTGKHRGPFLINLIDSPGHVDFSREVVSAVTLCDGALVLVDVLEGVCAQSTSVLERCWNESVRPCLVLNKIDKLFKELHLTPLEAYNHLKRILEQVNATVATLFTSAQMRQAAAASPTGESEGSAALKDVDDSAIYFSPERGNVVFASAVDGWAFGLDQFTDIWHRKLGMNSAALRRVLWGDYYYNSKTKRVLKRDATGKLKPMFVQFILEGVWKMYEAVLNSRDQETIERMIGAISVKVLPREIRSKNRPELLRTIMSKWLPIHAAVFRVVVDILPSPLEAQRLRLSQLWPQVVPSPHKDVILPVAWVNEKEDERNTDGLEDEAECDTDCDRVVKGLVSCSSQAADTLALVTKTIVVHRDELPEFRRKIGVPRPRRRSSTSSTSSTSSASAVAIAGPSEVESEGVRTHRRRASIDEASVAVSRTSIGGKEIFKTFVCFCRVLSGSLRVGDDLCLMSETFAEPVSITSIYFLMGPTFESLTVAPAGSVCGVVLAHPPPLFACATLCSLPISRWLPPFPTRRNPAPPIVRVAVSVSPLDTRNLMDALATLARADAAVEVSLTDRGEHVIAATGELHLEHCIRVLEDLLPGVDLSISPPLVPFRESLVLLEKPVPVVIHTADKAWVVELTCEPLPSAIVGWLEGHMLELRRAAETGEYRSLLIDLTVVCDGVPGWQGLTDSVWAFGPNKCGPNVLLNGIEGFSPEVLWRQRDEDVEIERVQRVDVDEKERDYNRQQRDRRQAFLSAMSPSLVTGFQRAVSTGPLCEEPLWGVAVRLRDVRPSGAASWPANAAQNDEKDDITEGDVKMAEVDSVSASSLTAPSRSDFFTATERFLPSFPSSGPLISAMRDAVHAAMPRGSARLVEAMFDCSIIAEMDVLGRVYAVLSRRRGQRFEEDMKEGTNLFLVRSRLPAVELFGFADELRKRTSGAAWPQLVFCGWQVISEDPFYVPTTPEELEELGDIDARRNVARELMNAVRRRKGLFVEEKLVLFGEKQRTLSRKK